MSLHRLSMGSATMILDGEGMSTSGESGLDNSPLNLMKTLSDLLTANLGLKRSPSGIQSNSSRTKKIDLTNLEFSCPMKSTTASLAR